MFRETRLTNHGRQCFRQNVIVDIVVRHSDNSYLTTDKFILAMTPADVPMQNEMIGFQYRDELAKGAL
jgi:hypothetical protein